MRKQLGKRRAPWICFVLALLYLQGCASSLVVAMVSISWALPVAVWAYVYVSLHLLMCVEVCLSHLHLP